MSSTPLIGQTRRVPGVIPSKSFVVATAGIQEMNISKYSPAVHFHSMRSKK